MRGCPPSRGATCPLAALRRRASASPHRLPGALRANCGSPLLKRPATFRGDASLGVALLLLAAVAAVQAEAAASSTSRRYTIAPLRRLDERVDVFTLPERLVFAGTAMLPPMDDAPDAPGDSSSAGDGGGADSGGGAGESERGGSSESGREQGSSSANDGASDQGTQGSDTGAGGTDLTPSSSSGANSSDSGTSAAAEESDLIEAVEQRNEQAIRRIRYPQGARQGVMRAAEGRGGSAESGGEDAAAAPSSAPAPAPAPAAAVDPLLEQFVQQLARAGAVASQETEVKAVVRRRAAVGFPGISQYSEVNSGTAPTYNHSVVRVTPPDGGLCVGNGYILQTVNVGPRLTHSLLPTQAATAPPPHPHPAIHSLPCRAAPRPPQLQFVNVLPSVVQRREPYNASVRGDNIGDMSCTYDPASRRFFLSSYWLSGGASNGYDRFGQTRQRGNRTVGSGVIVAASTDGDPTQPWNVFFIPGSPRTCVFSTAAAVFNPPLGAILVLTHAPPGLASASWCAPCMAIHVHSAFSRSPSSSAGWMLLVPHTPLVCHAIWACECHGCCGCAAWVWRANMHAPRRAHGALLHMGHCCTWGIAAHGSNDGNNSNPDWGAPLYYNTSKLTTLQDYPQIGTDAHGVFVSVNQFGLEESKYFGANIYAMGKQQLFRTCTASILRFAIPYSPALTSPSYTVYPHKVPADGSYDTANNGTMYFGWMAVNFNGAPNETVLVPNVTIVGAFALTGTSSLGSTEAVDRVVPHIAAVETPPFFMPMPVRQRPGPTPTAWRFNRREAAIDAFAAGMQAVVVQPQRSTMWLAFTSAFGPALGSSSVVLAQIRLRLRAEVSGEVASEDSSGEVASGEASGEVASGDSSGEVACVESSSEVVMNGTVGETEAVEAASGGWSFEVQLEGFKAVGVQGNSLLRPAMALNRRGRGILAAALAGPSFYPSAAYARVDAALRVGPVTIAAPGRAPLDDYSGYLFEERVMRYGDYHTATTDEHGNAWAVVEYVPGVPRTQWTNWATYIFKVHL
ncbi:unnamed protein product [Closterium sp. NIES-64]|nr:unnamed protein product [Closterium sp. NIES-64]